MSIVNISWYVFAQIFMIYLLLLYQAQHYFVDYKISVIRYVSYLKFITLNFTYKI